MSERLAAVDHSFGPSSRLFSRCWQAKGESADDLGACEGSYKSPLPTRSLAAEVEARYACTNVHAVCGWAVHFRPSFLSLLSIPSPTAGATSIHNLFLVMHGHIPRDRLVLLQLVFDYMVKRHGLGAYAYTCCQFGLR
jgi:hypothetical protein